MLGVEGKKQKKEKEKALGPNIIAHCIYL